MHQEHNGISEVAAALLSAGPYNERTLVPVPTRVSLITPIEIRQISISPSPRMPGPAPPLPPLLSPLAASYYLFATPHHAAPFVLDIAYEARRAKDCILYLPDGIL